MTNLLWIDTTQTQRYIFGSNRLRENINSSYLVAMATEQWVLEAIFEENKQERSLSHNVLMKNDHYQLDYGRSLQIDGLAIEVITAGGGNSLILGRDEDSINRVLYRYSRALLKRAPNIPIYHAISDPFEWDDVNQAGTFYDEVAKLLSEKADRAKRLQQPSQPLLGMSVSLSCRATGLPAVAMSPIVANDSTSTYPISAEFQAKHDVEDGAEKYLMQEMPIPEENGRFNYLYPYDFDNMGVGKGEANYIAIVHADGDGIGGRFIELGKDKSWPIDRYIAERRRLSDGLKQATRAALQATLNSLLAKLRGDDSQQNKIVWFYGHEEKRIELEKDEKSGRYFLPFRPIISGGDDVTFVCNGRLGLALAENYAVAFREAAEMVFDEPISASAGVSIVRTHYPFARAYELAEELMENAKNKRKFTDGWGEEEIGVVDWHFTVGGLYAGLEEIRQREYRSIEGDLSLALRPVALIEPLDWAEYSWQTVRKGIDAFQEATTMPEKQKWSTKRNKVKALREALRKGKTAVLQFSTLYLKGEPLPDVGHDDFQETGFNQDVCGYFDSLELADWYIPINYVHPKIDSGSGGAK